MKANNNFFYYYFKLRLNGNKYFNLKCDARKLNEIFNNQSETLMYSTRL